MQRATEQKALRLTANAATLRLSQAVARIESEQNCSGVLIGQMKDPDSPAYLLTAGHCLMDLDDVSSSQRIVRDALPRSDRNLIHWSSGDFRIGRVLYATMKAVDLAIAEITAEDDVAPLYQLTERKDLDGDEARIPRALTLRELKEKGLVPLPWAADLPAVGAPIRIISADVDEDNGSEFLREHRCRHEGLTDVIESIWHWQAISRNNCEDIQPGTSGAPVLTEDAALFAIVNTSSRQALGQDCYLGQPCELTETHFQVAASRNYGSVVYELSACFNAQGVFSPDESRCPLEARSHINVLSQVATPWNPGTRQKAERRWNVTLRSMESGSQGFHYKSVRLPGPSCDQREGYSERIPWSDQRLRELATPLNAGLYALCVVSDREFQQKTLTHAVMIILNIDGQPPQLKPRLVTNPQSQEPLMAVRKSCSKLPAHAPFEQRQGCAVAVLSLEVQPYEIVDFYHGWTTIKNPDCQRAKAEGHGVQLSIPVKELPANLCIWAVDGAGNRSQDPVMVPIRAASRREIMEATDVMVDWSFRL